MAVEKVTLTLDSELLAKARRVAGRRGLSALVADALRIKLQHERLRALLIEMDAEFGPVPPEEIERARSSFWKKRPDVSARKRRSQRSA